MASVSDKQRKFMWIVHGVQKGKISPSSVGNKIRKASNSMRPDDVKEFLMQECGFKQCETETKRRILKGLKEIQEPMRLEEENPSSPNVIASSQTLHGDFDQTLKMYRGFQFTPKENQAIQSFTDAKPSDHNNFSVKYSKSDDFTHNSTIVIKKLRDPSGKFTYTAFLKVRGGEKSLSGEQPEQSTNKSGDEIKVVKSIPIDDKEGSEILTNFLQAVYHQQA